MKLQQLSIFLENQPGRLSAPCRTLARAGINIITLSLADTRQFGILRLIVPDWERARDVLEQDGCVVNLTEVIAVEVTDQPGGLAEVLELLEAAGVSIEYMYAFTLKRGENAVLVLRLDKMDEGLAVLQERGVSVLQDIELYGDKAGNDGAV